MRRRKKHEEDEPSGAPQWMLTFCDCMTLMLTFFVMLFSFSCFDEEAFLKIREIFGSPLPAVATVEQGNRDAFLPRPHIQPPRDAEPGSEFPTLSEGQEPGTIKEGQPAVFRNKKVFTISSRQVFWGKGTVISQRGRSLLTTMARFMKEVPNRVVIGESGPVDDELSRHFGLRRAWAVMDYLTAKRGPDKKAFSISATTMLQRDKPLSERVLEITILERSIYE